MEKKKFIFVISSEITTDGDTSNIKLTTTGNYSKINGRWVLLYDEMSEDKTAVIKTMVKVNDKSVTITRNGEGSSKLIVTEGERNMCHYRTQFGDIEAGTYIDCPVSVEKHKDKWIYRAAIPWAELFGAGRPVSEGYQVRLGVLLNDNDGDGRKYVEFCEGIASSSRPNTFINVTLEAKK